MISPTTNRNGQATNIPVPKIQTISVTDWKKGIYTRYDSDRVPTDGLVTGENVQLDQNGTITPRPGLKLYGTQPTGIVLGQIFEYVRISAGIPETWNIWMENRSGTGTVITSKNGGSHTVVTGKTYSSTAKAHFEQVYGVVLIMNGTDNLSYMDVQTQTITSYSALPAPGTLTTAPASALTSSPNINLRYRYTATSTVGETAASVAGIAAVNRLRESWDGTTQYTTLTIPRVTGAARYNIYVGDQAGSEYYLDSVADPGTGTNVTYTDIGTTYVTTTRVAPPGDSTAGPKVTRATNFKGQPYMVGDTENPGRIWFGGTIGSSALDFSSFNGGGWVEPNKGGKDFPVVVKPFRDGKGTPMAVCFTKGTNGAGKRLLLQNSTTTLGTTVITYMSVQEDNGQDGTDSPDGVVMLNDAAWYPSHAGFKTSSTKANIQNIISTNNISDNIGPNVNALSSKYMDSSVGLANDERIYWALPFGSTTNNQLWVLDLRQQGAWMQPMYISADWLWLYADNTDGQTKMLGLVNNQFVQFDSGTATNDNGTTFGTNITSGDIKFSEDGTVSATVLDITFVFLRSQGTINLSVSCNTEDGDITLSDQLGSSDKESVSGFGLYGWGSIGWGNLTPGAGRIPIATNPARVVKTIDIDEDMDRLTWNINTNTAGVSYQLAEVIVRYVAIGFEPDD